MIAPQHYDRANDCQRSCSQMLGPVIPCMPTALKRTPPTMAPTMPRAISSQRPWPLELSNLTAANKACNQAQYKPADNSHGFLLQLVLTFSIVAVVNLKSPIQNVVLMTQYKSLISGTPGVAKIPSCPTLRRCFGSVRNRMEAAMGLLDNVLDKSLPQGSGLAETANVGFHRAACIRGPLRASEDADLGAEHEPGDHGADAGGLLGGLGGLLREAPTQNGHGEVAKTWVGSGQNQPIQPGSAWIGAWSVDY